MKSDKLRDLANRAEKLAKQLRLGTIALNDLAEELAKLAQEIEELEKQ
jgi:hypothetical protein